MEPRGQDRYSAAAMMLLPARISYSRAERLSDAAIHISGLSVALVAVPVLVTLAVVLHGDAPRRAGPGIDKTAIFTQPFSRRFGGVCDLR